MQNYFKVYFLHLFLIGGCCLLFSGCGIKPLYTSGSDTEAVIAQLSRIDVEDVSGNAGRHLVRDLNFSFGNTTGSVSEYSLRILLGQHESALALQRSEGIPHSISIILTANYILKEKKSGKTLLTGSAFANASFDNFKQEFANQNARQDAEKRAAKLLSEDIYYQINLFFSRQPTSLKNDKKK